MHRALAERGLQPRSGRNRIGHAGRAVRRVPSGAHHPPMRTERRGSPPTAHRYRPVRQTAFPCPTARIRELPSGCRRPKTAMAGCARQVAARLVEIHSRKRYSGYGLCSRGRADTLVRSSKAKCHSLVLKSPRAIPLRLLRLYTRPTPNAPPSQEPDFGRVPDDDRPISKRRRTAQGISSLPQRD